MDIMKKPATAERIVEWILRNTKVSELEEMTLTISGPEDMVLHILGSKIRELNRRERERWERER